MAVGRRRPGAAPWCATACRPPSTPTSRPRPRPTPPWPSSSPAATCPRPTPPPGTPSSPSSWVPDPRLGAPSCTFLAAVVDGAQVELATLGDCRSMWLPADGDGEPETLTEDDSWAAEVDRRRRQDGGGGLRRPPGPRDHPVAGRRRRPLVGGPRCPPSPPPARAASCSAPTACGTTPRRRPRCAAAAAAGDARRPPRHRPPPGRLRQRRRRQRQHHRRAGRPPPRPTLERTRRMSFSASVYQNEFLPDGATEVNAVVTVTGEDAAGGPVRRQPEKAVVLIVDTSGSMEVPGTKIRAARRAAATAIRLLPDGTLFALVAGTEHGRLAYPPDGGLVAADERTRQRGGGRRPSDLRAGGGTAMSTWLDRTTELLQPHPEAIRLAYLLTDGINQGETRDDLDGGIARADGRVPVRHPGRGRRLGGGRAAPHRLRPAGRGRHHQAARRDGRRLPGLPRAGPGQVGGRRPPADVDAEGLHRPLRPPGGAHRRGPHAPRPPPSTPSPTTTRPGAWSGDESRDYHVCVDVLPAAVGDERLAARISLMVGDDAVSQGLVRAVWTDDEALSTRINAQVAHYTGQAELAQAIQEGLQARKDGDIDTATVKLGRAVQLATQSGNEGTVKLLRKVVEVEDADTGTVRVRREVDALDEMELDTRSTRTVRVQKGDPPTPARPRRREPTSHEHDLPVRHLWVGVGHQRLLRRVRGGHRSTPPPRPRPPAPAAGRPDAGRPPSAAGAAAAPPARRPGRRPTPATSAARPAPPTTCSARCAGSTSSAARCRRPPDPAARPPPPTAAARRRPPPAPAPGGRQHHGHAGGPVGVDGRGGRRPGLLRRQRHRRRGHLPRRRRAPGRAAGRRRGVDRAPERVQGLLPRHRPVVAGRRPRRLPPPRRPPAPGRRLVGRARRRAPPTAPGSTTRTSPWPTASLRALHDGDRLLLGAFTCITIRHDAAPPPPRRPTP